MNKITENYLKKHIDNIKQHLEVVNNSMSALTDFFTFLNEEKQPIYVDLTNKETQTIKKRQVLKIVQDKNGQYVLERKINN